MSHSNVADAESAQFFLSPDLLWVAIVDSSDDAIISKDLNGIIKSWNKSAERIFGYKTEEVVGKPILLLLPEDRKSEETGILQRLRAGERVDHFETVRVRKDGRQIDVSLTISPIKSSSGAVIGASKIARDVTDQKLALQQLAAAHKELQQANRMKGEFISTLSHELRTPLNAIMGWTQILKDYDLPEEVVHAVDTIDRNVRLQSQLIEDLLDMSRIESGKLILDVQRLDLAAVVMGALDVVRPAAAAKEINLTSVFSSVEGGVMGDKNRMHQIVWNLVTNAIKFTPRGGRVHVTLERVNSHVEIAVTDNGAGIAPEFLEHIFERFSQGDSSTTRKHGGLGLGLSIAKNLVEMHGGVVRAKSDGPGKGSAFIVSLPLVAARHDEERSASERRNAEIDGTAMDMALTDVKILVVDDDPDSVEIVRRILERTGGTVRTAFSMEEGLKAFSLFRPDVILSDIGMPDHDGFEFISRIRQLPNGKMVPGVALTALARPEDRTRALRAGFQVHVPKPVDASELVAVVRSLANLRAK